MINIGWIFAGTLETASVRFTLRLIRDLESKHPCTNHILWYNPIYAADIQSDIKPIIDKITQLHLSHVVFCKTSGIKTRQVCEFCNQLGISTVFFSGDWFETDMFQLCKKVVVCSMHAKELVRALYARTDVHLWRDYYPTPIRVKTTTPRTHDIVLGWYGNFSKLPYVMHIYENRLHKKYELITVSNTPSNFPIQTTYRMGDGTDKKWDDAFLESLLLDKVDVVIVPIDLTNPIEYHKAQAKSANRILLPMLLGIPVVCTPITSYMSILVHNVNGLLVWDELEWPSMLLQLESSSERTRIGSHARQIFTQVDPISIINEFYEYLNK